MSQRIGYGWVSSREKPGSQRDPLKAAGCDKTFIDVMSGKLAAQPELDKALALLRPGDVFVLARLSRAARSLRNLLNLIADLRKRGVDLEVLTQDINTATAGRAAFGIFGSIDEFLRDLIGEGTQEGLAAARARGRKGGRPAAMTEEQILEARRMYDEIDTDGERVHTAEGIARAFGVSRATIYRHLQPGKNAK